MLKNILKDALLCLLTGHSATSKIILDDNGYPNGCPQIHDECGEKITG